MSNINSNCALCSEKATLECYNCSSVLYCSKEHMKKHSADHKNNCKPYVVKQNEVLGRYLVASRDIKKGELIIRDSPGIIGPRTDSCCICMSCYIPLYAPVLRCSECDIAPLCVKCKTETGHSKVECNVLESAKSKTHREMLTTNISQYILPLRCLFQLKNLTKSDNNNLKFHNILHMEAHLSKRRGTDVWEKCHKNVVQVLQSLGIISTTDEDSDCVQRICGILDVNSFEVRGPVGNRGIGELLRGLYLEAALMAHDCVGNTLLSVDSAFQMTIHASVNISKGELILFNYTGPLQGTLARQEHLKEGKYFDCVCRRCLDPTELGTHMSSLKCVKCKNGMVSPNIKTNTWQCGTCNQSFSSSLMQESVNQAQSKLEETDKTDTRVLEKFLKQLLFTLSHTHSVILDIKQTLVALYRDSDPSKKILQRKIELCQDLLPILAVVEPGISRLKGMTLYELHYGFVMMAERHTGSPEEIKYLTDAEKVLREAVSLLVYEPPTSPEGELARRAMTELKCLRQVIQENILFSSVESKSKEVPVKGKKATKQ